MNKYRLQIWQYDRLWGCFESEGPQAKFAIQDMHHRLPAEHGFQCKLFIARDEKRIIESGPAGIRLLAAEVLYEEKAWPLLIHQPA
jgi:hypothetical protein